MNLDHSTFHRYPIKSQNSRWRRRTTLGLVSIVATLSTGSAVASEPSPSVDVPDLAWAACFDDFECATLDVPLDYDHPGDRTISLAAIRRPAADPARRIGVLYLQPGGPGGSGVDFVRNNYADLPPELQERFDVVSLDVRGVGRSSPVTCWSDDRYSQAISAARGHPGLDAFATAVTTAADFDAACDRNAGGLIPYVGTEYVARDIDLFRTALGEQQLTYYGRSFGTYIGTVYANIFPDRVRAMTLDGAYDPQRYAYVPYAYDRGQYLALDGAVERFLRWCEQADDLCPFGSPDPRSAFDQLIDDLDHNPVPLPAGGTANGYTLAYRMLFNINEGRVHWPAMGQALAQAQRRDPTSFLLRPPSPASFDFLTPNVVVECVDRSYPSSINQLEKRLSAHTAAAPLLGPAIGYGPPTYDHNHAAACVQWSADRSSRYDGLYNAAGSPPILVLGTTGDPDTPYRDAVALSRILNNGSLLTFDAEGHTAFGRSVCATDAVTRYLIELSLPPAGTVCADEQQPGSSAQTPRLGLIDMDVTMSGRR